MHRTLSVFVMMLLGVAIIAGCASNDRLRQMEAAMRAYDSAVRWGEFRAALGYIDPEEHPDERELNFLLQRFEQVRVTGYRETARTPGPDENTVIRLLELRIANRHTAAERVVRDRQVWRYDPEAERWWQVSGLPEIGRS